jgi:BirA family biotin operon repressor/biotin-[acetyl-CoA-carboxylase] ligase
MADVSRPADGSREVDVTRRPARTRPPDRTRPPERVALDPVRIRALLAEAGWSGPEPLLLSTTTSTNVQAAQLAADGAAEGTCVVSEQQTAGRGRLGRTWLSPPYAGLWMSVVVRAEDQPVRRLGWLPLAVGLATMDAVRSLHPIPIALKWPNDLMARSAACGGGGGLAKFGGILAEREPDGAVVVGIGLNVAISSDELPVPTATSLYLEGGSTDRDRLLVQVLVHLQSRLRQWRAGDDALARDYRQACATLGRRVDVQLPGNRKVTGVATGIDEDGHLVVDTDGNSLTVTAGDVIHATI